MSDYDGPERRNSVVETEEITQHVARADRTVRWLSISLVVVLFVGIVAMVTMTSITLMQQEDTLDAIEEYEERRTEQVSQHRVRNELLHECIVDLIFAVITSEPDSRANIPNPCPESELPVDVPPRAIPPQLRE